MTDEAKDGKKLSLVAGDETRSNIAYILANSRYRTITDVIEVALIFLMRYLQRKQAAASRGRGFRLEVVEFDKDDPDNVLRRTELELL